MQNSNASGSVDLSLADFQKLGNGILPRLDAIREHDPIYWSDENQCWIVTGHRELVEGASGDLPLLSCERLEQVTLGKIPVEDRTRLYPTIMRYMPNWIINFDPPVHTRLRKLVVSAMNKRVLDALRPFVQERVRVLLDKLEQQPTIEFNEEIARELTGSVILKLIGLPPENIKRLRGWANALMEAAANPNATHEALLNMDAAMADMNTVLAEEIDKRRSDPKDDLLTALIKANEDGDRLSMDEMLGALHVLIIAGHDTTMNSMTLGVVSLSKNPGFWDYMFQHPAETPTCVLELMRQMAMATSQTRFVLDDFEWGGKQLRKGQVVFLMVAAGNRDPLVYPKPETLDPKRGNLDVSLTFNPGLHHCIGHALAKLQLGIFFGELVQRFESAEILDDKLEFLPNPGFRGLYHLNVRMKLRHAKHNH
jgi:pimeloyl-[acyl-carrier protein] synthase